MRGALLVIRAGALAQFRWLLATPAAFIGRIVITPVLTSIFFFLFLQISGRLDALVAFAVVAPALSTAWSAALGIAGETVDGERA